MVTSNETETLTQDIMHSDLMHSKVLNRLSLKWFRNPSWTSVPLCACRAQSVLRASAPLRELVVPQQEASCQAH
jgi:hypothetical protein